VVKVPGDAEQPVPCALGSRGSTWTLTWPLQQAAGIAPVTLRAHYGTTGDWPLNVFDEAQAAAELPTLRAMAALSRD